MTLVKFTIQRDGRLDGLRSSRSRAARRRSTSRRCARSLVTQTLPPLPDAYPNPTLTVHLNFEYK